MFCTNCGRDIPQGAAACPACGAMQNGAAQSGAMVQNGPVPQSDVVSLGDWMISTLLVCIPIVGLVMLFVWGFGGSTNPSKRNWARASLVWMAIGIVFSFLFGASIIAALIHQM